MSAEQHEDFSIPLPEAREYLIDRLLKTLSAEFPDVWRIEGDRDRIGIFFARTGAAVIEVVSVGGGIDMESESNRERILARSDQLLAQRREKRENDAVQSVSE